MPKYFGAVGYVISTEKTDGVWEDTVTEVKYRGDIVRNTVKQTDAGKTNNDISVGNSISIVADPYASAHFFAMRYVTWMGVRWVVSEVEVKRPRLILHLGGRYNGPTYVPPSTP